MREVALEGDGRADQRFDGPRTRGKKPGSLAFGRPFAAGHGGRGELGPVGWYGVVEAATRA